MCMHVCLCVGLCTTVQVPVVARGGCLIPWCRSYKLSDMGAWEEDSGPLPEQCVLLTTEFSVVFHLIFDTEPVTCQFG